jgi:nucleoside-diphosphate-sugar epimerase
MTVYAVTGASGHLGRLAVQQLLARGVLPSDIVAVVRSRATVPVLLKTFEKWAATGEAAVGATLRCGPYSGKAAHDQVGGAACWAATRLCRARGAAHACGRPARARCDIS